MHVLRSFRFGAAVILLLAGFTACGKVHPASQTKQNSPSSPQAAPRLPASQERERVPVAVEPPTAVAFNKPAPAAPPADSPKESTADLNPLNLEVTAMETLNQLKLTRSQLERLKTLAPMTVNKPPPPRPTKVSDEYHQTLKDLRAALLEDNEVRVADLSLALDDLRDKENPDFDEVEITAGGRRHAAEVLRKLSAGQVMAYLSPFADEFPDPAEKLTDAFEEIRKLPAKEWEELRDEVAGQVGWLVAGLDPAAEKRVHDRAAQLLDRVRRLKQDDFTAQQAELEKAVQNIVGTVGPTEVIRHFMERSLAELLSNPRLPVAVEAMLKKAD